MPYRSQINRTILGQMIAAINFQLRLSWGGNKLAIAARSCRLDSLSAIAAAEGMSKGRVSRIMQLLQLSPERVHEALKVPGSNGLE